MSKERGIRPLFLTVLVLALIAGSIAAVYLLMPRGNTAVPAPTMPERKAVPPEKLLTEGKKLYSQFDEELVIRHFFKDRQGGVFIDVGCAWPIHCSTTYYLEKHLGWTGIGIDAQEFYREAWEANRPNSKFFAYAVTDHAGDRMTFYTPPNAGRGLASLSREYLEKWDVTEPIETEVETITLNKLLEDNGISNFDFLSMDIEGAEVDALKGFDIERFRPSLCCVEIQKENVDVVHKYFADHGYTCLKHYRKYDKVNWYFAPAEEAPPDDTAATSEETP
ncbi:MAG: FkbM family methyltransferase [Candidatus Hydrogenedentota bacterium]